MKKISILFFIFLGNFIQGNAQKIGDWRSYLSYYNTTMVTETPGKVYAIADGALYSYDKEDNSIKYYSKVNGLNDSDINNIGYSSETRTLVLIYSNGNIDLINEETIYNLPYLKNSTNFQDKTVYSLYFFDNYVYLAAAYGITVIDLNKNEIVETYRSEEGIVACVLNNNYLYAATTNELKRGSVNENLIDPGNWDPVKINFSESDTTGIKDLVYFDNRFFFLFQSGRIFYLSNNSLTRWNSSSYSTMKVENNRLITIPTSQDKFYVNTTTTNRTTFNIENIQEVTSAFTNDTYWIAGLQDGLIGIKISGNNVEKILSDVKNDSPKRNYMDFMLVDDNKLLIAGGGRWTDRYNRPGTVMIYENNEWFNINESEISTGVPFRDAVSIAVDPKDKEHYYVSTWGEGIFEFKDNEFIHLYTHANSELNGVTNNPLPSRYTRIGGMCFDKNNNLWITNTGTRESIKVLKEDGTWCSLYYEDISNITLVDKILIHSNGDKWVLLPRRNNTSSGIFVFNDNGTIENVSDDSYKYYATFTNNNSAEALNVSNYYCMTEDKNGQIWLGTNIGPLIIMNPNQALTSGLYASRIIQNDEYYFLDGVRVNAIAVDGGNRKWIGTEGSGVFLVNEDGREIIHQFSTDNSPLLSDNIVSIAINDNTGEVFIGTDKGLISYMSEATKGSENYSNIYAYPNPVRPEFHDQVVITGLMEDSNVKITDTNGNIIYQGKSSGGQIIWNCRNHAGKRVASGVYLVLASTSEAKESIVTKIAVVK